MGRFSKLETGAGATPETNPDEGPFGLRTKVRSQNGGEPGDASVDYDQGHYQGEGERLFYTDEFQKAMRAYSRAMQVDHSAIEPWIGQVLSLVKMKQYREAAMWALRATEMFPEDARLASLQGLTLPLTGARQRAIACSDFAMARPNGGTAFTWAVRGQILSHSDNPNAAFCFEKVMETREANDWQILAQVGDFLLTEKKWARAAEYLKPAVEAHPSNSWLWKRLGFAYEQLAFTQKAMSAYKNALAINPNDRDAENSLRRLTSVSLPMRLWRKFRRNKSA